MEINITWHYKHFEQLLNIELYQLLSLRSAVFVVEQNCVYQDVDYKDQKAIHLMGLSQDKIVCYCRLFKPGDYFDEASIGRVVIDSEFRQQKLGYQLMKKAISIIQNQYNQYKITISAQLYLKKFYETNGFTASSEIYFEDGIKHIQMKRL